jgi:ABC-type multidrug transport system permease subunit
VHITASEIDSMMDQGKLLFVVEIPPNFEADVRAQRKTGVQINVDATAVAQAGNGASYLRTAIANEIQRFLSGRGDSGPPINLVVRAAFNPNLKTSWFSAMTQVINQITLLTVILTGAALIREREQGTVEHLLVMPLVSTEIMLAKMFANALVILVAAMFSLQFVVHWWIGSPINGSLLLFLLGAAIYALVVAALGIMLGTLANAGADGDSTAVRLEHADGEHAGLAAICDADDQPDAAFRRLLASRAVPRRRHRARVATARGDAHHRRGLFRRRPGPLPAGHFRRMRTTVGMFCLRL